ncbi:chromate efflux transporter [Niastella sp. OAS944]|uniref:chromate efflux transporter n=1 Tax=Niastella sp. OAS944 TaxID=2664089 RepID=UPI0034973345|nr:chromate transporter [Chitinophagaceae bacterium OAS944]
MTGKNKTITKQSDLAEIARLFLKLGIIGFGGPAAHIALMQQEVVTRRQWMGAQHFLDLVGATNLIPGPNSTEMTMHIGRERAGAKGLIVAGACFILPAVIITGLFAWLYKHYGQLPNVRPFIYGIKPAIIAIILSAVFPLAKQSLKTVQLTIIGLLALVLSFLNINEIYIIFGAGLIALLLATYKKQYNNSTYGIVPFLLQINTTTLLPAVTTNWKLFFVFLKIGAILYGSGYVLFAYIESELVANGILTHQQLTDAIAVGQFTPGPVFSAVTFIGYQINGITGAIVSTIAIFLPSFLFVALLNPLVKKMRSSTAFAAFLDGVNVASVAVIFAVCYVLAKDAITDWRSVLIGIVSLLLLFMKKINSAYIILGGAIAGYLLNLF